MLEAVSRGETWPGLADRGLGCAAARACGLELQQEPMVERVMPNQTG